MNRFKAHSRDSGEIDQLWQDAIASLKKIFGKVLVLDDDPTGSQTVYDLPVYTGYGPEELLAARRDESQVVYVLTNSRSLHAPESEELHNNLMRKWNKTDQGVHNGETLVVSRSDSTLRGHYPLETDIIARSLNESLLPPTIIIPFFPEGGRYTFNDIHYVLDGDTLVPAAETEFARDSSFGYSSSNLRMYVEEKTLGRIAAEEVYSLGIEELRNPDILPIIETLNALPNGSALIVNAISYDDLKVFITAFAESCRLGRRFVFRSAAGLVKILAGIKDRPLLESEELMVEESVSSGLPGLLVAGSYVSKTTEQLKTLVDERLLVEVQLNIREALWKNRFEEEIQRVSGEVDTHLNQGQSVVVYTTNNGERRFLKASESDEDLSDLELSARISDGLVRVVSGLKSPPGWVITKGGITSHDIATRGIGIRKAMVLGQILPGVPVWRCGDESRWPGIPLVIFPGNVGNSTALRQAVQKLLGAPGISPVH